MHRSVPFVLAAALVAAPALAQVQRLFPYTALRGEISFDAPPTVRVNGQTAQLAPGAHIRDAQNMGIVFGALEGSKAVVNYTVDQLGQPKEIWVLTAEEAARKPWPRTEDERQAWQFDYVSQTWTKP